MKNSLKKIYRATVGKIFPDTGKIREQMLRKELKNCRTVLDLGCGPSSPLKELRQKPALEFESIGVDIFEPYILKNLEKEKIHSKYLNANILTIDFPENSFDCAILIDVIEHLEKRDFLEFLPKLSKIAKKIIIITPNDFIEQNEYDNNPFQVHRSGWTVKEMETLGFDCFGLSGWKKLRTKEWKLKIRPFWIGEIISNISQSIVYKRPYLAYHIVCIKNR